MIHSIIQDNQKKLLHLFKNCQTNEEIYKTLLTIGQNAPLLDPSEKTETNRVHGCQSQLFLTCSGTQASLHYKVDADALISKGLAGTLIAIYEGAAAEDILKTPLTFFQEIGLHSLLSPTRLNGLEGLERKAKQLALSYII